MDNNPCCMHSDAYANLLAYSSTLPENMILGWIIGEMILPKLVAYLIPLHCAFGKLTW